MKHFKAKTPFSWRSLGMGLLLGFIVTTAFQEFFTIYKLQFPLSIKFRPVVVKREALPTPSIKHTTPTPKAVRKPTKQSRIDTSKMVVNTTDEIVTYIKSKFGKDAPIALAIQHAEDGTMNCQRQHLNDNGTLDMGLFQINSVHSGMFGKLNPFNCKDNIDLAYKIYSEQGNFSAWSTYLNGSYLSFLN